MTAATAATTMAAAAIVPFEVMRTRAWRRATARSQPCLPNAGRPRCPEAVRGANAGAICPVVPASSISYKNAPSQLLIFHSGNTSLKLLY